MNGGTCGETSTYLVNDYWRKFRCGCPKGLDGKPIFRGHTCEVKVVPGAKTCALQLGAKSAKGSTSTLQDYKQLQVALEFTGVTLKSSDTVCIHALPF